MPGADVKGPCPGRGYTCDDCLDGWFCPPVQTPAWPAPCGHGWPCYQCESGWFCVPSRDNAVLTPSANVPASSIVFPTPQPATERYRYAGCYADDSTRVLSKAETLNVRRGMTNEACIEFCQRQGFTLAGTEDGAQCFCGDVLIGSASLPPGHCNSPCTGDLSNSTVCGGPWALSVWGPGGTARQEPRPLLPPGVFFRSLNGGRASPGPEMITAVSDRATGEEIDPNSSDVPLGLGDRVPGNSTMAHSGSGNTDDSSAERGGKGSVDTVPRMAMGAKKRSWGPRGKARWS